MPFYCKECDLTHAHYCPAAQMRANYRSGLNPHTLTEFIITCTACGCTKISLEKSPALTCDGWCDFTITCLNCGAEVEL